MPIMLSLVEGWTVRAVAGPVPDHIAGVRYPATVPGCVHLDLLAAGAIADPDLDENEAAVAWIGRVDWRYETRFDWTRSDVDGEAGNEADLVALGLDTVATVELNGVVIARTMNMHRSYRFPAAGLLRTGGNDLAITFGSALAAAEQATDLHRPLAEGTAHPFNAIRKMACNFGWDWGPDLVTAGIWRPIGFESWRNARLAAVRPLVEVTGTAGLMRVQVELQVDARPRGPHTIEVEIDGRRTGTRLDAGQTSAVVEVEVPDVRLWWPHGYGTQSTYPVTVSLSGVDGCLDEWQGAVGFRSVRLDTTPDEYGTPFTLLVNDTPIFARGVNWIPDDTFPATLTRHRYAERLNQACAANVNLIRVWGGGIYESEDFYELCDELGLLVWQDFLFACASYAEEEPLRGEVIAEAREAITRLSPHPSLVLWNGCNENLWGHEDWGWKQQLGDRTWGLGYYTDVLPGLLAELDPSRPYCPGSPYSPTPGLHPNDPAHGTMHIWDVWNQRDYAHYRAYRPRFVSEFGFQAPPTWATLTRAIHDEPLAADSAGMLAHQKASDGNGKLARGLHGHLPPPATFDDWHWATSLNQARAVAFGIEHFRSWTPVCMGTVLWQLNDCWPVTSWAAIDGDGRRKPMWYALRSCFRDRLLTLQPRDDGLALVAVNDSPLSWRDTVELARLSFDGTVAKEATITLDIAPRGALTIPVPADVADPQDPTRELIRARCSAEGGGGFEQAWWHFAEDVDADLREPEFDSHVEATAGGYRLHVTARTMIRDLAVLADRLAPDAVVDDMLVTLLPGETATFVVLTAAPLESAKLIDPLVLRCANQLISRSVPAVGSRP